MLSNIWYIVAIVANCAWLLVIVYIAILATAWWLEKRMALRDQRRRDKAKIKHQVRGDW